MFQIQTGAGVRLFADFDNDGWKDLFISNGYLRDYTNMDFLKFTVADAKIAAAKKGNQNFQTYDLGAANAF